MNVIRKKTTKIEKYKKRNKPFYSHRFNFYGMQQCSAMCVFTFFFFCFSFSSLPFFFCFFGFVTSVHIWNGKQECFLFLLNVQRCKETRKEIKLSISFESSSSRHDDLLIACIYLANRICMCECWIVLNWMYVINSYQMNLQFCWFVFPFFILMVNAIKCIGFPLLDELIRVRVDD